MESLYQWLLSGPAWVEYRTRMDLLKQSDSNPEVISARRRMLTDPLVSGVITELADWPGHVLNSHKSAGQLYHKLNFLADIGVKFEDDGMNIVVEKILSSQSEEGPFQLPTMVPVHFGGSGLETGAWALCDAPLLLYALSKMGLGDDPRVRKGAEYLLGLVRENGWPCVVSKELGKFRGPGRKEDPCPYATLAMIKLLSVTLADRSSPQAKTGVESLLNLWQQRQREHPYMFYMGTDFIKLKAPLVWFDLLHVLDVLSNYPDFRGDPRLASMFEILTEKEDETGRYTPESVWMAWKEWEFGQKKVPSFWITFLAHRIIMRVEK